MLILVHLFKVVLIFLCFNNFATNKQIIQNQALVRIPGKALFFSDFKNTLNAYSKISCLKDELILYKLVKTADLKKMPIFGEYKGHNKSFQQILNIEKLKTINYQGYKIEDDNILNIMFKNKCVGVSKTDIHIKELFALEIYLRGRFSKEQQIDNEKIKIFVQNIFKNTEQEWLIQF